MVEAVYVLRIQFHKIHDVVLLILARFLHGIKKNSNSTICIKDSVLPLAIFDIKEGHDVHS